MFCYEVNITNILAQYRSNIVLGTNTKRWTDWDWWWSESCWSAGIRNYIKTSHVGIVLYFIKRIFIILHFIGIIPTFPWWSKHWYSGTNKNCNRCTASTMSSLHNALHLNGLSSSLDWNRYDCKQPSIWYLEIQMLYDWKRLHIVRYKVLSPVVSRHPKEHWRTQEVTQRRRYRGFKKTVQYFITTPHTPHHNLSSSTN